MSENMIVFDTSYTSDQAQRINDAKKIIDEAIKLLNKANSHSNWRCVERLKINARIDDTVRKLDKLGDGMTATASALRNAKDMFADLEDRSQKTAITMRSDLKNSSKVLTAARKHVKKIDLPTTRVPEKSNYILQVAKEALRTAIIAVGSVIGAIIGMLLGAIQGLLVGFLEDLKQFVTDLCNNISILFKNVMDLFKPGNFLGECGEIGKSLVGIAGAVFTGFGLAGSLGHVASNVAKGTKVGEKINKVADVAEAIGDAAKVAELDDAFKMEELIFKADDINHITAEADDPNDPHVVSEAIGIIADAFVPFGLDKTLFSSLGGGIDGLAFGATLGAKISTQLCENFLGQSPIPGLTPDSIEVKTGKEFLEENMDGLGIGYVYDVADGLLFNAV